MSISTEHPPTPTEHPPKFDRTILLLGALASASAYSLYLNTEKGKEWADEKTWATVVVGVMLTTGWISLEDRKAGWLNCVYFFVTGVPIIFRSLNIEMGKMRRFYNEHIG